MQFSLSTNAPKLDILSTFSVTQKAMATNASWSGEPNAPVKRRVIDVINISDSDDDDDSDPAHTVRTSPEPPKSRIPDPIPTTADSWRKWKSNSDRNVLYGTDNESVDLNLTPGIHRNAKCAPISADAAQKSGSLLSCNINQRNISFIQGANIPINSALNKVKLESDYVPIIKSEDTFVNADPHPDPKTSEDKTQNDEHDGSPPPQLLLDVESGANCNENPTKTFESCLVLDQVESPSSSLVVERGSKSNPNTLADIHTQTSLPIISQPLPPPPPEVVCLSPTPHEFPVLPPPPDWVDDPAFSQSDKESELAQVKDQLTLEFRNNTQEKQPINLLSISPPHLLPYPAGPGWVGGNQQFYQKQKIQTRPETYSLGHSQQFLPRSVSNCAGFCNIWATGLRYPMCVPSWISPSSLQFNRPTCLYPGGYCHQNFWNAGQPPPPPPPPLPPSSTLRHSLGTPNKNTPDPISPIYIDIDTNLSGEGVTNTAEGLNRRSNPPSAHCSITPDDSSTYSGMPVLESNELLLFQDSLQHSRILTSVPEVSANVNSLRPSQKAVGLQNQAHPGRAKSVKRKMAANLDQNLAFESPTPAAAAFTPLEKTPTQNDPQPGPGDNCPPSLRRSRRMENKVVQTIINDEGTIEITLDEDQSLSLTKSRIDSELKGILIHTAKGVHYYCKHCYKFFPWENEMLLHQSECRKRNK